MERRKTRAIHVGPVALGGDAPVAIQSMTTTDTADVFHTVRQIQALKAAGCDLVRVAVPDKASAFAIHEIREQTDLPIVADIHFDHRLALEAVAAGAHKIRINPGNIGPEHHVEAVARACRLARVPIRIGVNGGSLSKDILAECGGPTPEAICLSAERQMNMLKRYDFEDICLSLKSSNVPDTVEAYRRMAELTDAPFHIGITETGPPDIGRLKSAVGIGTLLLEGIGDTLRVSLTADPVEEVKTALQILQTVGLRARGLEIISCPTCGRCKVDLFSLVAQVSERLQGINRPLKVAVMGCGVNGPGEAREADVGLAGGDGECLLFAKGDVIGKFPQEKIVEALARFALSMA